METKVIIIHGEKQLPNGNIHPEYIDRMKTARTLFSEGTVVVLTGGSTRARKLSESEQAKAWFLKYLIPIEQEMVTILTESDSRTTAGNILGAQSVLKHEGIVPREVIALMRSSAGPKTEYLYSKLWCLGKPHIHFVQCMDLKPLSWRIADRTILYLAAIIDPRDEWVLALPKKLFRNG